VIDIVSVPIEQIKPYPNNPRRIPADAVAAVAKSLQLYGWQQPIVVDKDRVIIVGHTRREAALSLGYTHVPIYVSDLSEEKAREYRLVDNRTSEFGGWDHQALVLELREFEAELLESFFPEIDLEIASVRAATAPSEEELSWAANKVNRVTAASEESQHLTEVVCPSCFHTFQVRTRSLPGMDRGAVEELLSGGQSV
jgi:hypothetical protein